MSDIINHLTKNLSEELDGVVNYVDLSKMAEKDGDHGKAAILKDMAREEFCHAKHLKMMIHEKPGTPPANHAEMAKKWKDVQEVMDEL